MRSLSIVGFALALLSATAACTSEVGTAGTCEATGTGSLTVNVVGLPSGVDAKVQVTGPGGTQSASGTKTFAAIAGGSYTITADKVTQPDPLVRTVYSATISESVTCVGASAAKTVTVTYAPIPTSNKLWLTVSNSDLGNLLGYSSASLGATGEVAPAVKTTSAAGGKTLFDKDGNLWATGGTTVDPALLRISANGIVDGGQTPKDRSIGFPLLDYCGKSVSGLAFDKAGNLWWGAPCKKAIYKFAPSEFATSGDLTASFKIDFETEANAIAFDKAGNLWVIDVDGRVERFDAAALGSASATPSLTLGAKTTDQSDLLRADRLAFDAAGNLWATDFAGAGVYEFPVAELGGTVKKDLIAPTLVSLNVSVLLEGMAFDEGGGLWLAYSAGKFARLSPAQLATGGAVTPERVIQNTHLGYAVGIEFYPAPAALPLFSALP